MQPAYTGPSFLAPDTSSDLDAAKYLERVPDSATCKGMFFLELLQSARHISDQLPDEVRGRIKKRYIPFKDYPLREHMELTASLARPLFPGVPTREGVRRLGRQAYPVLASSLVGRVALGLLDIDIERVVELAPRAIELSLSVGRMTSSRLGPRHYLLDFQDVFGYIDCYYVGVIEGAIRHHDGEPAIKISSTTLSDATFDVTWT